MEQIMKNFIRIIFVLVFILSMRLNAGVGVGYSDVGTLSSKLTASLTAVLNSITPGPDNSKITLPENGKAYLYYKFISGGSNVYSNKTLSLVLKTSGNNITAPAMFTEAGIFQIELDADYFKLGNTTITLPDSIMIADTLFTLSSVITANINKVKQPFTRTWDIFAGGSAGVSGSVGSVGIGASVAAAKLSVKGEAGMGLNLQLDQNDNLFIDRRFEFGVSSELKAPSLNFAVGNVSLASASISSTTLVGQKVSFSDLSISEDNKKLAKAGYMLETLSLGGVGLSPTAGIIIKAIVNLINNLGGASQFFNDALLEEYWGTGLEGSVGAGFNIDVNGLRLDALSANAGLALNAKFISQKRNYPSLSLGKRSFLTNVAERYEFTQGINFNFSVLSIPNTNLNLFDAGTGGEIQYTINKNVSGMIDNSQITLKGGGNVGLLTNNYSTYYSTVLNFPKEYNDLLIASGKGIAGLLSAGLSIPIGLNMASDAVENFKTAYNATKTVPVTSTKYQVKGKGKKIGFDIDLDIAAGVGFGGSFGMELQYFDEIEFPYEQTEIYSGDKQYLINSSGYDEKMDDAELNTILKDLFSGTIPLIKNALSAFINNILETVQAGEEKIIEAATSANKAIGKIKGSVNNAGKWLVSVFNPDSPRSLANAFQKPQYKKVYTSNKVLYKTGMQNSVTEYLETENLLLIVSDAMEVGFIPNGQDTSVSVLDNAVEIKLFIDNAKLSDFDLDDSYKDRIKIYKYIDKEIGWVNLGGIRNADTLTTDITEKGTYALGIELYDNEDNTAPSILEKGPAEGTNLTEFPLIYAKIKDNQYGTGIDLSNTFIILDDDTLDISYNPSEEKIFYQLSVADSLVTKNYTINFIVADLAGNKTTEEVNFHLDLTSVEETNDIPDGFMLEQNYPNPFNPTTTISFYIHEYTYTEVNIYDIKGRFVKSLFIGNLNSGNHKYIWDGTNNFGNRVSSGCYFYQVKTNKHNEVKKMLMLK